MSDNDFSPRERYIAGRILERFLSVGAGTPAHQIRSELLKERRILDGLLMRQVIREIGGAYYPRLAAADVIDAGVRDYVWRATALILDALKGLFRLRGLATIPVSEVVTAAQRQDAATTIETVNLGLLMALDFTYLSSWSFGKEGTAANECVLNVSIREDILDYESFEDAWEAEMLRRAEVKALAEGARGLATMDVDREDSLLSTTSRGEISRNDLHPWGVVLGILAGLSSDDVVQVVSTTGLQVDWRLTPREAGSHKTRIRAYLPRIQEAYAALSADKQLVVAALVAVELTQVSPDRVQYLRSRLSKIGWNLEADRLVPVDPDLRELFFPKGTQHDAYVGIRSILRKATTSIIVIDPYIDGSLLKMLTSLTTPELRIQILSHKIPEDFGLEANRFLAQHPRFRLEVRVTAEFHDRFLVLDETKCFHLGASIKDAGKRAFMISKMEDARNRETLLVQHSQSWGTAKIVFP